jgi:transcriptional regulator with XRE-family HTH domain
MKRSVRTLSKSQRKRLGAKLRELREAHGLRQVDVAEHFGTDSGSVCRMELGEREPSLYQLTRAAALFGVPATELIPS